jgi:hypothetical protein
VRQRALDGREPTMVYCAIELNRAGYARGAERLRERIALDPDHLIRVMPTEGSDTPFLTKRRR